MDGKHGLRGGETSRNGSARARHSVTNWEQLAAVADGKGGCSAKLARHQATLICWVLLVNGFQPAHGKSVICGGAACSELTSSN